MRYTDEIGKLGEDMTAAYLKKQGYIITRRNYRSRFGEIDIVAENREYTLFVEVKTREKDSLVMPQGAVTRQKQKKIVLTGFDFLRKLRIERNYRFDIAEVTYHVSDDGEFHASLNYIENAFNEEVLDDSLPF